MDNGEMSEGNSILNQVLKESLNENISPCTDMITIKKELTETHIDESDVFERTQLVESQIQLRTQAEPARLIEDLSSGCEEEGTVSVSVTIQQPVEEEEHSQSADIGKLQDPVTSKFEQGESKMAPADDMLLNASKVLLAVTVEEEQHALQEEGTTKVNAAENLGTMVASQLTESKEDTQSQSDENSPSTVEENPVQVSMETSLPTEVEENNQLFPVKPPEPSVPPLKISIRPKPKKKVIRPIYSSLRGKSKCHICSHYIKRSSIARHIKYMHGEILIQCTLCKRAFGRPDSGRYHLSLHHQIDSSLAKQFLVDVKRSELPQGSLPMPRKRSFIGGTKNSKVSYLSSIVAYNCHDCDGTFVSPADLFYHCDVHRVTDDGKKLPTLRPRVLKKRARL